MTLIEEIMELTKPFEEAAWEASLKRQDDLRNATMAQDEQFAWTRRNAVVKFAANVCHILKSREVSDG